MSNAARLVPPARAAHIPQVLRLALLLPLLAAWGPCGPIPGGRLTGGTLSAPLADWSFTDAHSTVQVETRPEDPYSVTTWCVSDGARLYVPSRSAARKPWVKNVLADPRVQLRVGDAIYALRAERVTDAAEQRHVLSLLRAKYRLARWSMGTDPAQHPGTWYFRLEPAP